jgi:hypothetical protein
MLCRSRFEELGGYVEAPPPNDDSSNMTVQHFIEKQQQQNKGSADEKLMLVHPTFESVDTLRVAEDLRFFHTHLFANGSLRLLRTEQPLVTYKHRLGQSQSSKTPRRLLLHLRTLALEQSVLNKDPRWQHHQSDICACTGAFVVWGAGRDGKDFVKALSPEGRKRVYCFVDVDDKKIEAGFYVNRQLDLNIPIVHFSLLAKDPDARTKLYEFWENGSILNDNKSSEWPNFGRIDKSKASEMHTQSQQPTPKLPAK